jgi:hypothetical protein
MNDSLELRTLYQDLADGYAGRGQPQFRDRFLVLAAAAALEGGEPIAAERLRQRLLAVNPHHLLKPYATFTQAMQVPDVQEYIGELRKDYPPIVARGMLDSLRDLKETENEPVPMTAPLLDLSGGPDLLMDDDAEPLKIFSLRNESPSGIPPTLPPEMLPRPAQSLPPRSGVPPTLYEAHLPPELPPRPRAPRPVAPSPMPIVSPSPKAARQVPVARPMPKLLPPAPIERTPAAAPAYSTQSPESEAEVLGAWVCLFLFVVAAVAGLVLLYHALVIPLMSAR